MRATVSSSSLLVVLACWNADVNGFRQPASSTNRKRSPLSKWPTPASNSIVVGMRKEETALDIFGKSSSDGDSNDNVEDDTPSIEFRLPYAAAWLFFFTFGGWWGPGTFGDPADAVLVQKLVANPTSPGINEITYFVFSIFAIMPFALASILLPQASNKGLPVTPFLWASTLVGYFAVGPYLTARAPPLDEVDPNNLGWFTRNVLESKLFQATLLAYLAYLTVSTGLVGALSSSPPSDAADTNVWQEFGNLLTSSRAISASTLDLTILHVSIVALTPRDYMLRNPSADRATANKVAAVTALVPYLGTILYCLWRPALPQNNQE